MEWQWKLIERDCTGCGICADVCEHGAIRMTRWMAYPEPAPARCTGCKTCAEQCPSGAIAVKELAATASDP